MRATTCPAVTSSPSFTVNVASRPAYLAETSTCVASMRPLVFTMPSGSVALRSRSISVRSLDCACALDSRSSPPGPAQGGPASSIIAANAAADSRTDIISLRAFCDDSAHAIQGPRGLPHGSRSVRDATGWEFNFPPRDGVHYLVHPVIGRLGSRISATFVVERDGRLVESDPCAGSQAAVRLFFQRRADDLTAAKEFHRWSSMSTFLLTTDTKAGLTVALDPWLWSSVLGKVGHSSAEVTAAFQAAAGDVQMSE